MMGGPTWEEPTGSHALVTEPGGPSGTGRDLPVAVLTGVVLFLVAAISLLVAKAAFVVVGGAVVLLGQAELYATVHRSHYQPATALGLVIGGLVMAGGYLKGEVAMTFFLAFGMVLVFLWYMAGTMKGRENAVANIGSTLLGVIYVPFLATYAFLLLAQANSGRMLMLVVIGLTVAYDISAFFFGTFWGSHPLAPSISPKKSREGLLGATVVTFALAIGIVPSVIDYLSVTNAVGLAVIVSVFAPLGDLAESALKRDLGVKDMGSILPGHGGILDRIDSLLFVAPAAWYFLRLIL
jgi:phosphatidate cytidylyltransferase